MKVTILPSKAKGTVKAPPSKSMAHRMLIAGALSKESVIENVAFSEDIQATLDCLKALGATVVYEESRVRLGGLDPYQVPDSVQLCCRESGSTLRFLIPLCLLCGKPITFVGAKRLLERPLSVYEQLCQEHGLLFRKTEESLIVCGQLTAGNYTVPGDVSSQFITGLLFALSLVKGESRLEIAGRFESESYVNLTVSALQAYGVAVQRDENTYMIRGKQTYHSSTATVEGDFSNAAFLEGFNLLDGDVKVTGLTDESAQGDRVYRGFYRELNAGIPRFDLTDCPDLGPVMFALAALCGGAMFTGIARLRIKESDRVAAMTEELAKFGVKSLVSIDSVTIRPGVLTPPKEVLSGHNDHRIVMALCLLCSVTGGTIEGAEAVAKSYPDYFDAIHSLGIEMKYDDVK